MNDPPTATMAESSAAQLLDVRTVARILGCSARHVYRMSDGGAMPAPLKIGALVRWSRQAIEDWIAGGCRRPGRG